MSNFELISDKTSVKASLVGGEGRIVFDVPGTKLLGCD